MRFAIAVHGAPYASQAAWSACRFVTAAVAQGHEVMRVFFYHDGVRLADGLSVTPQEDQDLVSQWQSVAEAHDIELAVCIAACLKRGILNDEERNRYEKTAISIADGFEIVGLGQLIDATMSSDRFITFAD